MNPINSLSQSQLRFSADKTKSNSLSSENNQSEKITKELYKMSELNKTMVNYPQKYELNLSHEELEKRVHKDYMVTKKCLHLMQKNTKSLQKEIKSH